MDLRGFKRKTLSVPDKKQLEKDYEELKTGLALAKKYNVSYTTIRNWFKKLGIKTWEERVKERIKVSQ